MPDNSEYFDFEEAARDYDEDDFEARIWNLFVLINPADEELALQQFDRWRDALQESGEEIDEGSDWLPPLMAAIAWQSGFEVERGDADALMTAVNELAARWNLQLDWGGDLDDDDFAAGVDATTLMATAYDRLREHNYSLWSVDTGGAGLAGWMALSRDDDAMLALCSLLGVEVRPGSDPF